MPGRLSSSKFWTRIRESGIGGWIRKGRLFSQKTKLARGKLPIIMFECVLKCLIAWPANANQLTLKPIKLSNVAKFPLMSQRFLGPIAVLLVCFLSPFFSYAQYHKHDLRFTRLTDEIGFFSCQGALKLSYNSRILQHILVIIYDI